MFDFHGWITLRESTGEEREDDELLRECVNRLCVYIGDIEWVNAKAEVLTLNGQFMLVLNGAFNHRDRRVDILYELLEYVMREFPGAFGLLYEKDDEGGVPNAFSVGVIKRGQCEWRMDPFLSPIIPTVEDKSY